MAKTISVGIIIVALIDDHEEISYIDYQYSLEQSHKGSVRECK